MMNEQANPVKKPHGCLKMSGCLLTIVSTLLIVFFVSMFFYSEEKMDEKRAEYAASVDEYEEAMKAYEADSTKMVSCQDSLNQIEKPEFHPRGAVGFNIAGGFFLVFALLMLIPLVIGLLLLFYYRRRLRKWKNSNS